MMRWRWMVLGLAAVAAAVLTACGSSPPSTPGDAGASASTTAPVEPGPVDGTSPVGSDAAGAPLLGIELVDARTGETFSLADYQGTSLYVQNFATWCVNCRQQLTDVQSVAASAPDDLAFVALSVETDLDRSDAADYFAAQGFDDIRVAVMSEEMLAAMNDQFGNSSLNPPSTPHFVVGADGEVGALVTGPEDPEQVLSSLRDPAG